MTWSSPPRTGRPTQPAAAFPYAMRAGREVRVMVLPDLVDDIQAQVRATEVAR